MPAAPGQILPADFRFHRIDPDHDLLRPEFQAPERARHILSSLILLRSGYAVLDLAYVDACRTASAWRIVRDDLALLRRTVAVMAKGEGLRF